MVFRGNFLWEGKSSIKTTNGARLCLLYNGSTTKLWNGLWALEWERELWKKMKIWRKDLFVTSVIRRRPAGGLCSGSPSLLRCVRGPEIHRQNETTHTDVMRKAGGGVKWKRVCVCVHGMIHIVCNINHNVIFGDFNSKKVNSKK